MNCTIKSLLQLSERSPKCNLRADVGRWVEQFARVSPAGCKFRSFINHFNNWVKACYDKNKSL